MGVARGEDECWGMSETGEGDLVVQTSSCKINVTGIKYSVGNIVNNNTVSLYKYRP